MEVLWFGSFAHYEEFNGRSWWRAQVMELSSAVVQGIQACRVAYVGWDGWNEWVDFSRLRWMQLVKDIGSYDSASLGDETGVIPLGTKVEVLCPFDEHHPDVWMEGTIESSRYVNLAEEQLADHVGNNEVLNEEQGNLVEDSPTELLYSVRSIVTGPDAEAESVVLERRRWDIRVVGGTI